MAETRIRLKEDAKAGDVPRIFDAAADTATDFGQQKPGASYRRKEPLENDFDTGSVVLSYQLLARRLGVGDVHGGLLYHFDDRGTVWASTAIGSGVRVAGTRQPFAGNSNLSGETALNREPIMIAMDNRGTTGYYVSLRVSSTLRGWLVFPTVGSRGTAPVTESA